MPRPLKSVTQCGYVDAIHVDDSQLDAVVNLLQIGDDRRLEVRDFIYRRLEDFKTARSRTFRAKGVSEDLQDLEILAAFMEPERMAEQLHPALDALESLRTTNLVLYERLQRVFRPHRIENRIASVERGELSAEELGQEFSTKIALLTQAIESEDGRGRPMDRAALRLASSLYRLWKEVTGRGTAKHKATGREKYPFGEFVEAAGRLIEPDFNGQHAASEIHDANRPTSAGRKKR